MKEKFKLPSPEEQRRFCEEQRRAEIPYPYFDEQNVNNMFERQIVDRGLEEYLDISGITEKDLKGKVILDIGSGKGKFLKEAAERGFNAIAVDSAYSYERGIRALKSTLRQPSLSKIKEIFSKRGNHQIIASKAESIPLADESIDIIFNIFSAYYYCQSPEDLENIWKEQLRILKPEGIIYIAPLDSSHDKTFSIVTNNADHNCSELSLSPMTILSDESKNQIKKDFRLLVEGVADKGFDISFRWHEEKKQYAKKNNYFVLKITKR